MLKLLKGGEILMIKGVTKSVIELKPKNSCFEKVIIILNSGCELPDTEELRREAELLTGKAPDFIRHSRRSNTMKMLISAVAGALVTAASFLILYSFV